MNPKTNLLVNKLSNKFTINPLTQRRIRVGGPTHRKQMAGFQVNLAAPNLFNKPIKPAKYKSIPDEDFCGEAGGYPSSSFKFPVDSEKRCRAALSYARKAPNPEGIRRCALDKAREKGWRCGVTK